MTQRPFVNTTHDWSRDVDTEHLDRIRRESVTYAGGGALHLVLEVLAYAADEAMARGSGRAVVTLHLDGSVAVADDGRGTDTRLDEQGRPIKKPVMATKDLRFFDATDGPPLPDGHPRRGMSVVAALSTWLVHTNRRVNGSWTQRYEHGRPVTDLTPVADVAANEPPSSGTTVHFLPDRALVPDRSVSVVKLEQLAVCLAPALSVEVHPT